MQRHASKNQKFHSPFFLILGIILLTSFSAGGAEKRRPFEKWAYLGDPVRGGEWRHATTVDPGLLNPNHWPVNNWDVIDSIYDSYFGAAEQQLPTPFLAESWNLINPLTFDIKLRRGIVFHDGSPLNAASLKYHLEWIKNRQNGCWNRVYLDPIKSIELIAEDTARLHFHLPFATVKSFLSYVPGFAVSMKALKNDVALREKERLARKARTLRKKLVKAEKKASKARAGGDDKSGKAARKAAKLKQVLAEVETRLEKIQAETQGVAKTDIHPVGSAAY
ncbi:MAG: hypothetical protein GY866_11310, partial [Proteobacteria bacterium]|nr:hypothetical protein [Pseudomonadota bacterium]